MFNNNARKGEKTHLSGETRIVKKFVIFSKIKNNWIFMFSFVQTEQIYDGEKWLFNRYITDESVLSKELELEIKRARGN
ncbi:MAG: hypothetical protein DA405_13240 [Bacteroidetes bacterium]|nr:MAG: hypothetical protein DA405_13240 [Bacteroidota bacterium]